MIEALEFRRLFAVTIPSPIGAGPGLTPSQVRHAYAFDQVTFDANGKSVAGDGRGQTIAIVTAYRSPDVRADLRGFDAAFGLANRSGGKPILSVAAPWSGTPVNSSWGLETALDVEWAHAIAPAARILLVEAKSQSPADLFKAVDWARKRRGVGVVSMSWGWDTIPSVADDQSIFATPARHIGGGSRKGGVTFVEAAADDGAAQAWPPTTANIVSVGGTLLTLSDAGDYAGETPLATSVAPATVAYDAGEFAVYHEGAWQVAGGTSAGAPKWAALLAIADQGRSLAGKGSLDGASQTLPALAALADADFHVILGGTAAAGHGSPFADRVIADMVGV